MTFFLDQNAPVDLTPRGPDRQPTSLADATAAGFSQFLRDRNQNFQREREVAAERQRRGREQAVQIGVDTLNEVYRRNNGGQWDQFRAEPTTLEEFYSVHGEFTGGEIALQAARERPDADKALSEEAINADVTARRMIEDRDEAEIIRMSPRPGLSQFLGGMAATVVDPVNVGLTLFTGGGGTIARIMAREAAVNVTAELPSIPAQLRVAEELEKPTPDIVEGLVIAGTAGAVLGGAVEGVARGIRYVGQRDQIKVPAGVDPVYAEASVRAAESALVTGENPLQAAMDVMRSAPPEAGLITPEATALAPDPITPEVLPPARPPLMPEDAFPAPEVAPNSPAPAKRPRTSKVPKKPTDIITAIVRSGGILKSSDRGDIAALELRRVGLLRTEAFRRSTAGDNRGGLEIDMMRERMVESGFLPEGATIDDLISAIAETSRGKPVFRQEDQLAAMDWSDYQASLRQNPDRTAVDDYVAMDPAPNGLFFSEDELGFLTPEDVARSFDGYLERTGYPLFPQERAEILNTLQTRGGDAQYLIEQALSREYDSIARTVDEGETAYVPWGDEPSPAGVTEDFPSGNPDAEPQTAAVDGPQAGAGDPRVENPARTAQPAQAIVPGTDRIQTGAAQRAKAEMEARQLQSRIGRLNQARVEDDATSMFAQVTGDIFDDITSPKAAAYMNNVQASLRADLEADVQTGRSAKAEDGRALDGLSDVLNELDDIDRMAAEYAACLTGKVTP